MRIPNAELAIIDPRKLTEYFLNPAHEDGRHKALLFRNLLGITADNLETLITELRQAVTSDTAKLGLRNEYGQRYIVDFEMIGSRGRVKIRSSWIIRVAESVPRLVTCYII